MQRKIREIFLGSTWLDLKIGFITQLKFRITAEYPSSLFCSAPYNGLYCFPYTLQGRQCEMTFTSVAGHLMSLDFTAAYKSWRSCNPRELYTAPIQKSVPQVNFFLDAHFLFSTSNTNYKAWDSSKRLGG